MWPAVEPLTSCSQRVSSASQALKQYILRGNTSTVNGANMEQLEMSAGQYAPAEVLTRNINTGMTDRKRAGL